MTATAVGEQIGESPTTCSFHLRQLAKYGFVEEAGGGRGRARPWRLTSIGMRISSSDDPETMLAASAVNRLFRERTLARYSAWQETKATYPRMWRDAANDSEYIRYLTVGELEQLNEELAAVLKDRFIERLTNPATRPPGAVPVELLLLSYPIAPPGGEAGESSAPPAKETP
jgi:predicted ArsR family transcriptional regulator